MLKTESDFWLGWLGRAGYAGRGLFYIIVGICALAAALLARHNTISEPSILRLFLAHIWGILIIALIGLAFAANSIWFFYIALFRKEHTSRYVPVWARHIANLAMSLLFAALAIISGALLFGWSPGRVHAIQEITVTAMRLGWIGRIGAGIVGVVVVGASLFQFHEAWAEDFRDDLDLHNLPRLLQRIIISLARFGLAARAAVIFLIGLFLVVAAFENNPKAAKGPTQSLQRLQYEPFGPILLGIIAVGLMAFGLWLLVEAWYRKIDKDARADVTADGHR
jgi:hypothetical protein